MQSGSSKSQPALLARKQLRVTALEEEMWGSKDRCDMGMHRLSCWTRWGCAAPSSLRLANRTPWLPAPRQIHPLNPPINCRPVTAAAAHVPPAEATAAQRLAGAAQALRRVLPHLRGGERQQQGGEVVVDIAL